MASSSWTGNPIGAQALQAPDGLATAPSMAFASEPTTGRYRLGTNDVGEAVNGAAVMDWTATRFNLPAGIGLAFAGDIGTNGKVLVGGSNGAWTASPSLTGLTLSGTAALATVTQTGKTTTYNGIATAGLGTPVVVAYARVTAQSSANASIATYTVGASDGTFAVSANMNVSAVTVLSTVLTCTYTDETNTSRSLILPIAQLAGTFIAAGVISATGVWQTAIMHIRAKASTVITLLSATGTFTGVTYAAEGLMVQVA
jgi:hypothetical protein